MKIFILILVIHLSTNQLIAQCNCEKIKRDDGTTVIQCPPLQVSADNTSQIGLSLASNGETKFLGLTIRFKGTSINVIGDITIRLEDNNMISLKLVDSALSYIGNSQVTNAIFALTEAKETILKNSNIKTLSFTLKDNLLYTYEVTTNSNVIKNQLACF
jgi:hypothetical protein